MGPSRSGGLGLRTSARRASTSKRVSATPRQLNSQNLVIVDEDSTLNDTPLAAIPQASKLAEHGGELWVNAIEILDPGEQPPVDTSTEVAPKEVLFSPRFKGVAEMEARRKMRM
jgi:target of rapamycin complex 2 subunit MAPKAP1